MRCVKAPENPDRPLLRFLTEGHLIGIALAEECVFHAACTINKDDRHVKVRLSLHLCACDPVSLAQESAVALSRRCPRRSRGSTSWASLPAEHAPVPPTEPHRGRRAWGGPHATRRHRRGCAGGGGGIRGHRVVEVGQVPWVLLVAASPVAADAQLRRWRHAGMSCGMYAHIPSRGPKHLLAPSQASQGMHMLRV